MNETPRSTTKPGSRRPRAWIAGLLLLAGLAVAAGPAAAEPCPEESEKSVRVDVILDQEEATIVVDPASVEIWVDAAPAERPKRVCWVITGLEEGQTLHLEGKDGTGDLFPNLERGISFPRDFANSGRPAAAGTWTYDVAVTDADGAELMRIDPDIVINEYP